MVKCDNKDKILSEIDDKSVRLEHVVNEISDSTMKHEKDPVPSEKDE